MSKERNLNKFSGENSMMYDVICVRAERHKVNLSIREVIERVNQACNEGYKDKKGWRPQGGISITIVETYDYLCVAQAIVTDYD